MEKITNEFFNIEYNRECKDDWAKHTKLAITNGLNEKEYPKATLFMSSREFFNLVDYILKHGEEIKEKIILD